MPCVDAWWFQVSAAVQALIVGLLKDLPAQKEILVLMTSECEQSDLPHDLAQLFDIQTGVVTATRPTDEDRRNFFKILFEEIRAPLVAETQAPLPSDDAPPEADETSPRITRQSTRKSVFGDLSLKPRVLSEAETRQLEQREHAVFRELRMYLRTCIDTLMRERKFHSFLNEEGYEHIEDYLDIVKTPMNLQLVLDRVNQGLYVTVDKFLEDIELICHNAVLYNPPSGSCFGLEKLILVLASLALVIARCWPYDSESRGRSSGPRSALDRQCAQRAWASSERVRGNQRGSLASKQARPATSGARCSAR
eukprot:m.506365 g.506365  ORF g.506365 m.506365 type:complete len:308 (+) comp57372_c0_seq13:2819-3742(+)